MTLDFTDDAIDAIARIAVQVNSSVENIGARRLQTVMERILDDISFTAPDRGGETVTIDAAYVENAVGDLAQRNADLSRFILLHGRRRADSPCRRPVPPRPRFGRRRRGAAGGCRGVLGFLRDVLLAAAARRRAGGGCRSGRRCACPIWSGACSAKAP